MRKQLSPFQIFDVVDQHAEANGHRKKRPLPIGLINFFILGQETQQGQIETFSSPIELIVKQNSGGYFLYFGLVKQADGEIGRFPSNVNVQQTNGQQTNYLLQIKADYYQPLEKLVALPLLPGQPPTSISVQPNDAYPRSPRK